MLLKQLQLTNFRNYTRADFSFGQMTLIVGPNGSGKTNILEAIYLLSRGKSFRTLASEEMVRFGEEVGRVKGNMTNGTNRSDRSDKTDKQSLLLRNKQSLLLRNKQSLLLRNKTVEVVLTGGVIAGQRVPKKRLLVNGVGKRLSDFVGQLKAVLFRPEDLDLILGSPSLRRGYLDDILSLIDRDYRTALAFYEKGLRQRNRLLAMIRESRGETRQLFYWNQLLVKNGTVITEKRKEFIDWLNQFAFTDSRDRFKTCLYKTCLYRVEYKENRVNLERLEKYQSREVAAGMTFIGPQRDDFIVTKIYFVRNKLVYNNYNNYNLAIYGSRGEQRLAVLWLKLMEVDYVEEKTGARPILLLDDIFSELDKEHRKLVKSIIGRQQTVVTATDVGQIDGERWGKVIELAG